MAIDVGTIRGLLQLKDEFTGTIGRAVKSMDAAGKKAEKIGAKLSSVGGKLTLGITAPIVALGAGVVKLAIDFESSFAGVRKTVDATEDEFTALADSLRGLAKEIPINVNELNQIAEAAGQLGIEKQNIIEFTKVMAQLGVSTNLSALEAAESLAQLANITGLPAEQFSNLGSSIVALGNKMATTEDKIVNFGLRIAGAGKLAGLTEADIFGIAAAFSSVGGNVEAAGTAVQKVLISMVKSVSSADENLVVFANTAGMTAAQFVQAFETDAAGAFTAFVEGLGTQGQKAFSTLDELELKDQRLIKSFLAAAGAGTLLADAINLGNKSFVDNTALVEEANKRFETFESQLTLTWNRLKDVGIELGTALLPVLRDVLDIAAPFVAKLADMSKWFAKLPKSIKSVVIIVGSLAAALGPVLFITGGLISAWGALAGILPVLGTALTSVLAVLSGPAGWIAGSIVLIATIKPLRDIVIKISKAITGVFFKAVTKISSIIKEWWGDTEDARKILVLVAKVLIDRVVHALNISWTAISKTTKVVITFVKNLIAWDGITTALGDTIGLLVKAIKTQTSVVIKGWKEVFRYVGGVKGLVAVLLLASPAFAVMAGEISDVIIKVEEAVEIERLHAEALEEAERRQQTVTDAIMRNIPEVEKQIEKIDKVTKSIVTYGSRAEDVIDVMSDMVTVFGDNVSNIDDNKEAYDALVNSLKGVNLATVDLVRLARIDLRGALERGIIDVVAFGAAMLRLGVGIKNVVSGFDGMAQLVGDIFTTMIIDGRSFGDVIGNIAQRANDANLSGFVNTFTGAFQAATDSGNGLIDSFKIAAKAAGGVAGAVSAIASALANTDDKGQRIAANMINTMAQMASGNYVGAAISFGTVLVDLFSNAQRSIVEVRDSFNGFIDSIVAGEEAVFSMGQALVDFKELAARSSGDASIEFRENFSKIVDSVLSDIERLGSSTSSILEVFSGLQFVGGLVNEMLFGNLSAPEIAQQLVVVRDKFFEVLSDFNQFLSDQSISIIDGLTQSFGDFATASAEDIVFAEGAILTAFGSMLQAGVPFVDILKAMGEQIGNIGERGIVLGVTLGNEFSRMGEMMLILSREPVMALLTGFDGVAQSVQAIGNMGLLTAEQLDFMGDRARQTFNQLRAAGLTEAEARAAMRDQLQILLNLQEMYGIELDASTQGLLDQAEAQGLIASKGLTANDIMAKGFERMLVALNKLIELLGGIPILFDNIADAADRAADASSGIGVGETGPGGGATRPGPGGPAGGGFIHGTGGFVDFGAGSAVILHGTEQVITTNQGASIAQMVSNAIESAGTMNNDEVLRVLGQGVQQQTMTNTQLSELNSSLVGFGSRDRTRSRGTD